mmetsp:Transcript_20308/g.64874  ORF Transcript_20308/g.64874 Transcript_20308/m.64874 type:complete len:309 (-) Transcript_20308:14-940(-)
MDGLHPALQQGSALLHRDLHTVLPHRLVVVFDLRQASLDAPRHLRPHPLHEALERLVRLDGSVAGNDRNRDTCLPAAPLKAPKHVDIVEELGDNKVRAGVHLLLEARQVGLPRLVARREELGVPAARVDFGVPGHSDAKVVAVLFADQLHQLDGVLEAVIARAPAAVAAALLAGGEVGRVAAQRQDVVDSGRARAAQHSPQVFARQVAGEVQEHVDTQLLLHHRADAQPERLVLERRPPGQRDERGLEVLAHLGDALEKRVHALGRLGREELERHACLAVAGLLHQRRVQPPHRAAGEARPGDRSIDC